MPELSINYSEALHTYTVLLKMFYLTNHYNGPSIYVNHSGLFKEIEMN